MRKSITCVKSAQQYSLFMSINTLSDADWTGTCRKAYTRGWVRIFAISCQEEKMEEERRRRKKKEGEILQMFQLKIDEL